MPTIPVRRGSPSRLRRLTRRTTGRLRRPMTVLAAAAVLLVSSTLASVPVNAQPVDTASGTPGTLASAPQLQAQVLTWTANNNFQAYASVPTTAVAGATTLVFENSAATGNTTGMQHTLTFDTGNPAYNSDVNVNILADPFDSNQGRWTVDVTLTPGTYRYFCAIPGHGAMTGLLVVTGGSEDTTPPTVTAAVTGDRNEDGAYVGAATVTLSATDSGSGVGRVEYALDGGPYGTYSGPVTVNAPGEHTVSYRATDVAGNTSPVQSTAFEVVAPPDPDTTAPTVTAAVTGDRNEDGAYVGTATVTLSATDTESGVELVEYSLDGAAYAAYTAPVAVSAVGAHTVTYRATDVAGNTSPVQSTAFTVVGTPDPDTTAPTATAAVTGDRNEDGAYVGMATVTISATDAESGVELVEYSLDGAAYAAYGAPVMVHQPGEHTVNYRATDRAGNTSAPQSVAFTVAGTSDPDTTPPTVSAGVTGDRDGNGAYIGAATVTVSATDTQSGVERIEYAVDGQAYAEYTAPVTVNTPGQHTVTYRATDVAGNTSPVGSAAFQVVGAPNPDTTAPDATAAVTGTQNSAGAYVGAATVTVTATDAESGVDLVEFSLDGQAYAEYTAPVTVNQPGQHTVAYRATDVAGNISTPKSVAFTVVTPPNPDTTAPTVTAAITGQQNGSWAYVGSATVTLTAADTESGVHRLEYALDGRGYTVYSGPLTVNTVGAHTVSYRATDRAGNTSGTASTTFTVVESAPPAPVCRVTDTRPTVWTGTLNSGVTNRVVEGRCSINDLIEDERAWATHAEFVDHVRAVAERLYHRGLILLKEHNILIRTAGDSGVGKAEDKAGYQPLLDRSVASFKQWEQVGAGGFGRNADGSITSRSVDGLGMLWFPIRSYGDFSLKLQWRDDAPGDGRANSGVFVRFPQVHQHPTESRPEWVAIKYGHELQINDRTDGDAYKSGSVYGFDRVDLDGAQVTPKGTWNDYEIRVVGQHYSVFRNGVLINEYVNVPGAVFDPPRSDDPGGAGRQNATGYVGLQNHGAADIASFRNIRIAPLTP
ncbi:OmpL47-type beta-barrel domain-containing protein [Micromonospora sp. NBC_01796]|uniref:OmpL47-type beta-barrel domain-containing protein n=1 Tax=Micromonospora sp. NBC_01796 TaxID=2975987 RepID=UPI003FA39143